jgi:hypothetical protein
MGDEEGDPDWLVAFQVPISSPLHSQPLPESCKMPGAIRFSSPSSPRNELFFLRGQTCAKILQNRPSFTGYVNMRNGRALLLNPAITMYVSVAGGAKFSYKLGPTASPKNILHSVLNAHHL